MANGCRSWMVLLREVRLPWTLPTIKPPVRHIRGRIFRIPEPFTCKADNRAGETIPIRLFLGGFDLTPTFRDVNKKFSTRYYLSLVLIDEGTFDLCS